MEESIRADVGLIKGHKADSHGNIYYWKSSWNSNPVIAKACDFVIAEVDEIVAPGDLDSNFIHTPSIFVDAIVLWESPIPIEKKTNTKNQTSVDHLKEHPEYMAKMKIAKRAA